MLPVEIRRYRPGWVGPLYPWGTSTVRGCRATSQVLVVATLEQSQLSGYSDMASILGRYWFAHVRFVTLWTRFGDEKPADLVTR